MQQARPSSRGNSRDAKSNNRSSSRGRSRSFSPSRGGSSSRDGGAPRRARPFSAGSRRDDSGSSSYSRSTPARGRSFSARNSRPQGGRRPQSNHDRPRGGGRGSSRRGPKTPNYNINQFINKATPLSEAEAPHVPTHQFRDFAIERALVMAIESRGYIIPSPIQDQSIPEVLRGRDVVGLANTGTGKTGAFLIPLLNKMLKNPKEQALIMAPTRELALQIEQELKSFVRALPTKTKIYSTVAVGGMPIGPQIRSLKMHNHFVIGTPGRLMDLMERRVLNVATIHSVVLDEADRMLDMGFIGDMRKILGAMPSERHTLFFSATLSPEIKRLVSDFLRDPIMVSVKKRDTAKNIDQDVVRLNGRDKITVLIELLQQPEMKKVIVFGETKHGVEKLSKLLYQAGIKAESIHGNKNHNQRVRSLKNFVEGRARVLTATDVAARGLDINDVTHVINYDLPQSYDDYVHRIGRTGRSDKMGKALTFVG